MQDNDLSRTDLLREEYTIDTPENVTFGYTIAGIGSRFIGCLVDTTILVVLLLLLNIGISLLLAWLGDNAPARPLDAEPTPDWITGLLVAIYALINFAIIWGYYMAFEMLWNGQTPGKRLANTQVVRANGAPAEFGEVAIRNVVRIIDFLPFAYAIGFVVMFLNRRSRRLGDFAANTLVIKRQDQVKLSDLVGPASASGTSTPTSTMTLPDTSTPPGTSTAFDTGTPTSASTPTGITTPSGASTLPGTNTQPGTTTPPSTSTPPGSTATSAPSVSITAETLAHFPTLSQMSEDEHQLVRETLARDAAGRADPDLLRRLAAAMAARVGARPPAPDRNSTRVFLALLADAYKVVNGQRDNPPPSV
jgi:uncharacterized RDD family membrane protein YckC